MINNLNISYDNIENNPNYIDRKSKEALLSNFYNYMKISEMADYTIIKYEQYLDKNIKYLNEKDFFELCISSWCNAEHFKSMIKRRGNIIFNGERLELEITQNLLANAMEKGGNVDKIKSMLVQRRRDINNIDVCIKLEREFIYKNDPKRFNAYEVPIRAFAENGWLTYELAKVGQQYFIDFMIDKYKITIPDDYVLNKWCAFCELLAAHSGNVIHDQTISCLPLRVQKAYKKGFYTYLFKNLEVEEKNKYLLQLHNTNNKPNVIKQKYTIFNYHRKSYYKNNRNNSDQQNNTYKPDLRLCSDLWNIVTFYM